VTDPLLERLRTVPTTTAKEALGILGVRKVVLRGLARLTRDAVPLAGRARTLRYLPFREDVTPPASGRLNRQFIETLQPDEVLVIDALGYADAAVMGDMLAARAAYLGVKGAVIDGRIRDFASFGALDLTVYARGVHPDPSSTFLMPWQFDVPIQCGGVLVQPGDLVLGDADAVVVVPGQLAGQVADRGEEALVRDEFSQRLLHAGHVLDRAFPIPEEMEEAFERYRATGHLPESLDR
jgi:5-oxopent-3-ene-1,2,5-tricarboxylate decarboxylase/2-hydroxyhepta-2,4-diene-1,7-dioate isomerase